MPGHVFSDLVGPGACAVRAFLPGAKISAQGGFIPPGAKSNWGPRKAPLFGAVYQMAIITAGMKG